MEGAMQFDFDEVIDRRGGDSYKWNLYAGRDVIPMPVADMDFKAAPAVLAAIQKRVEHGVFGYAQHTSEVFEAIGNRLVTDYGWEIDPEWIVWLPGLEVGLNVVSRLPDETEGRILCPTPIYPPFLSAPRNAGRALDTVPLVRNATGYGFDLTAFEDAITPETELMLMCNPHNPSGRVMSRAELEGMADLCLKHNLTVCSDEIHCGLVLDEDRQHIPLCTLSPEIAARTITFMSPSKTYNLAGLMWAYAIIPDAGLRRRFKRAARGIVTELNVFGFPACVAAYRDSGDWHAALLDYLRANRDLVESTVAELPGVWMPHLEATYLAWLDVRGTTLGDDPVAALEAAGIGLSDGHFFGHPGYVRLNFACPRSVLSEGLQRFKAALSR
jgi:cystathionine beta-lyase